MEASVMKEVARQFAQLSDPRRHHRRHPLVSLVTIAVPAVLCHADSWAAVVCFARQEGEWLGRFVPLPHGIPSRRTFERVFALLKPQEVEKCVARLVQADEPIGPRGTDAGCH